MNTEKFPECKASKQWSHDDMTFYLVPPKDYSVGVPHYCGYIRFQERPVIEPGYHGMLNYVPVHGGITYAEEDKEDGSMVYGFDCGHLDDEGRRELKDEEWLGEECYRMGQAIRIAAIYESRYLSDESNEVRAKVIEEYHSELEQRGINFNLQDNFGAMINVLRGKL